MLDRTELIEGLRRGLEASDDVRAAWLGGSDATGRTDEVSDVDLMVIAAPGRADQAIRRIASSAASVGAIGLRYRLPAPTWHGFEQGFMQFEDAPEWLMLDWLVMEQGRPHPWFEVERHGRALVLFDKDGDIAETHADRGAIDSAVRKKVEDLRVKYPLFRHMGTKLAARGLPADAAYFHQAFTLRTVVDLLRAVHCPLRHDFGFRYLADDLPEAEYRAVCRLCYPAGPEQIATLQAEADRLFEAALAAWDSRPRIA